MKKKNFKYEKNINFNLFFKLYFFVSLILIFLFLFLFFHTGYWSNYKNKFLNRLYTSSVNNYIYLPEILIKKFKSKFYVIPQLNLNISTENQINLEKQRKNALEKFATGDDSTVFKDVDASIHFNNKILNTNIRFKGDRNSHWFEKDRASYKIDLKGDNKIFGMEKFSLQKPRVRNYIHEWLYFELLGELNLIKLNYKFVNLSINGANSQLYAIEESFDKVLVERNKKRNGPIFSLHEEFTHDIKKTKFETYNKNFWLNEENLKFTQVARKKLEIFFQNEDRDIGIFDEEKWARFFAITDLNYYPHGRAYKSVKFFLNPVSAKFEPIGYDGHRSVPNFNKNIKSWYDLPIQNSFQDALTCKNNLEACIKGSSRLNGNYLVYRFFFEKNGSLNKNFYKKYRANVLNISSKKFLDNFFSERKNEIEKINNLIYDDYFFTDHNYFYGPGIYYFSINDIYLRAKNLRNYFNNNPEKIFVEQENDKLIISNALDNNLGLNIDRVTCIDSLTNKEYRYEINKKINNEFTNINLLDTSNNLKLKCLKISFSDDQGLNFEKIISQTLDYQFYNAQKLNEKNYKQYFNINNNILNLKSDNTIIEQSISIPKGYIVHILPGEKIILKNNSTIYSNSAWLVDGNKNKIIIQGLQNDLGGGIFINDRIQKSYFSNVEFLYLSGPNNVMNKYKKPFLNSKSEDNQKIKNSNHTRYINRILYGALNFYDTNITLKNIIFKNICSEDVVNVISSNFLIQNTEFEDNCSDSIDVDFGNGKILNSNFNNIGNDAIDFSGSNVELNNINIKNVGDKLVSIGENSIIKISNLTGSNASVGIATKDGSSSIIDSINIKNTQIGLAAYIKKNEYNPSRIIASNIVIEETWKDWLTDKQSNIIINNTKLNSSTTNIVEMIYGD